MAFLIEFLKLAGLFAAMVATCPLAYDSPNAPQIRDILGTIVLSVLAGHFRYAHMTTLFFDRVNTELLGMKKAMSGDAVRRALRKIDEDVGRHWMQRLIEYSTRPLFWEVGPWTSRFR